MLSFSLVTMLLLFISAFIGFLGVIYICYYLKKFVRSWKLLNKLPTPKTSPIVGHGLYLLEAYENVFMLLRKWAKEYGPVYHINITAIYPSANITGAEDFEIVASGIKNIQKSPIYNIINRWLGEGLLTSTGDTWQTRRKILTPAFHFGILQRFVGVFNKETANFVEALMKMDGDCVNIVPIMSQLTLKTIAETAMGTQLNFLNQEDKNFITVTFGLGKILFQRLMRPWLYADYIYYNLLPMGLRERKLINFHHRYCDKIIEQKTTNYAPSENYNYSEKKKLAMLDILLKAQIEEGLIDKQGVKDEVNTFMFEGHDTTAVSLCFTLMLLAYHKEVQDLVYREIVEVLGDTDQYPTINELVELKYMERCIKESLRLYPSVPFISRILEEDVVTEGGYMLPKDTIVNIHIFDIHRNTKYWSDPEKFDPDRFLPENCVNRHPFAYVPFSAGPRNCIGQKFGILEEKVVLTGILRKFRLESIHTPENLVVMQDILLRPKNEILNIKFVPRK